MPSPQPQDPITIAEPTPAQLQAAVERIRATSAMLLGLYLQVGYIVLETFYQSDFERWNRRARGEPTLGRLEQACQAAGLDWSEIALYRAVRLFEQSSQLGGLQDWPSLVLRHFLAVQGLDWETQRRLLDQAATDKLTGEALQELAKAERRKGKAPRERKENHRSEAKVALARLDRLLEVRLELVADLTALDIPEETVARCAKALTEAASEVKAMQEVVRTAKPVEP